MSHEGRRTTLPHLPALDALRALAVVGVFFYHATPDRLPGGFIGVDIFFVLSGYLITSLLLREAERRQISLIGFWRRRARRLLPAAWLLIAACLVVTAVFLPEDLAQTRRDALASLLYVQNWNLIAESQSYFGAIGRPPLLQHLWSLSIEEQFYVVWPLLLIVLLPRIGRRGLLAVCLIGAAASTTLMWMLYTADRDPSRVYYGTSTRATPLLLGAALAIVWPAGRLRPGIPASARLLLDAAGAASLVALLVVMMTVHDFQQGLYRGGLSAIALVSALLIAALVHPGCRLGSLAAHQPLLWLGERSYGIYLWHWPVIVLTRPQLDVPIEGWPLVALQASATLLLAELSYRYLEQPIRRHGFGVMRERLRAGRPSQLALARVAAVAGVALLVWSAAMATPRAGLAAGLRATPAARLAPAPIARKHHHRQGSAASVDGGGRPDGVLAIGDSVMLGAADALRQRLQRPVRVDADIGRQVDELVARAEAYRQADALPRHVVIQLGDNGPVWYADLVRLRNGLVGVPDVVFVNVRIRRSWQDEVNSAVAQFAHRWPQAHVADWYSASAGPGLLWDGEHPNQQGRAIYARVVAQALR